MKGHFKELWAFVDFLLICATFALDIVDIKTEAQHRSGVNRVRGLIRVVRILLLMRKVKIYSQKHLSYI